MARGYHAQIVSDGNDIESKVCEILGLEPGPKDGKYQPDILDEKYGVVGEVKAFKDQRIVRQTKTAENGESVTKERTHKAEVSFRTRQLVKYATLVDHLNDQRKFDEGQPEVGLYYFFACYNREKLVTDIYALDADVMRGLIFYRPEKRSKFGLKDRDFDRVAHIENLEQELLTKARRKKLRHRIIQKNDKTAFIILYRDALEFVCSGSLEKLYDNRALKLHYTFGCKPLIGKLFNQKQNSKPWQSSALHSQHLTA